MTAYFECDGVYYVEPSSGTVSRRRDTIDLVDHRLSLDEIQKSGFWVCGIATYDLAAFATIFDDDGCSELGFLVSRSSQNQGLLATSEAIILDEDLLTAKLAKKIATLRPEEIDQFNNDETVALSRRRYPNIRGFCQ